MDKQRLMFMQEHFEALARIYQVIDLNGMVLINKGLGKGKGMKKSIGQQLGHGKEKVDEVARNFKTRDMLRDGKLRI